MTTPATPSVRGDGSGIWLCAFPLCLPHLDSLLEVAVNLPPAELARYECHGQGVPFREFILPVEVAIDHATARLLDPAEEVALRESWDYAATVRQIQH